MIKIIVYVTKLIIAALVAILFTSCQYSVGTWIKGDGDVKTEKRTITSDFTKLDVSRGIEVEITQSDVNSVTVKADQNLLEHIVTDVENGVLIIKSNENIRTSKSKKVYVTLKNLESINASSGSEINSKNTINSSTLYLNSSSGSEMDLMVEAEDISCKSSSGSEIKVSGKALSLKTESSSGSEINASDLLVNDVVSKTSSGSSTKVNPIVSLDAKASSGSNILYTNTPKILNKKTSSGGSISIK